MSHFIARFAVGSITNEYGIKLFKSLQNKEVGQPFRAFYFLQSRQSTAGQRTVFNEPRLLGLIYKRIEEAVVCQYAFPVFGESFALIF